MSAKTYTDEQVQWFVDNPWKLAELDGLYRLAVEVQAGRKKLAAIRGLHYAIGASQRRECATCGGTGCFEWPCETTEILDSTP